MNYREPDETLYMMMNTVMASIGLLSCVQDVGKNKDLDSNVPKMIELLAWICEVERCTLYLYNNEKGWLYIKGSSCQVRKNLEISTKQGDYIMESFLHGKMVLKQSLSEEKKAKRMWLDNKVGTFTQNVLWMPINYADFSIGVLELVNKNRNSDFTAVDTKLVKQVWKELANGLLQEEMQTNIKSENMRELQMEKKLNTENLRIYLPLFNQLWVAIEHSLGVAKAAIFLYDKKIDHLYSVPQIDNEKVSQNYIKIHAKRGFVGKVFSDSDIYFAENQKEVDEMLESEEK